MNILVCYETESVKSHRFIKVKSLSQSAMIHIQEILEQEAGTTVRFTSITRLDDDPAAAQERSESVAATVERYVLVIDDSDYVGPFLKREAVRLAKQIRKRTSLSVGIELLQPQYVD